MLDFGGQTPKTHKKHDVFLQQSNFMLFCVTQITKIGGDIPLQSPVCRKSSPVMGACQSFWTPESFNEPPKGTLGFLQKVSIFLTKGIKNGNLNKRRHPDTLGWCSV
jgi:hypothetical protein